jgi:hypothetical protein
MVLLVWGCSRDVHPHFANLRKHDSERYPANHPLWWGRSNDFVRRAVAANLPMQKMIWKTDDYENISEAWEQHGTGC